MSSPHHESASPSQPAPAPAGAPTSAPQPPAAGHEAMTPAAPPNPKRRWVIRVAAGVVLLVGLYYIVPAALRAMRTVSTDDAYVNGHVTAVAPRVAGQVVKVLVDDNNPVKKGDMLVQLDREPYEIQVALKKAALEMAQADVLATRDKVRGIAAQAHGNRYKLEHAMEDVRNQLELLKSNVAQLKVEQANLVLAERDFARAEQLLPKAAISQQQFDQYKAALEVAKNRVKSAEQAIQQTRASLGLPINYENPLEVTSTIWSKIFPPSGRRWPICWRARRRWASCRQLTMARPRKSSKSFTGSIPRGIWTRSTRICWRTRRRSSKPRPDCTMPKPTLAQAELNLRYCDVLAEIDGVITRRNVNPGNNVQAGQSVMAIRSLTEIWIDANFKETQLAELRIGQPVDLEVDMYGSRHKMFQGRITGFTMGTGSTLALLPPQNATGNFVKVVQRLPVRIDLEDYNPADEHAVRRACRWFRMCAFKKSRRGPTRASVCKRLLPRQPRQSRKRRQT